MAQHRPALALVLLLAAARVFAQGGHNCVSDIRDAGPDGSFCHGSTRPAPDAAPAAPPVAPAVHDAATGLAGGFGGVIGAGSVPDLPPVDLSKYGNKRRELLNQADEDDARGNAGKSAQDILKEFSGPLVGDDDFVKPRSPKLPKPASKDQVDATIAKSKPFVEHDRKKEDDYKDCPSGCGCAGSCTPDCKGTCYLYGGKTGDPDGDGLDCSGLVGNANPCFWYGRCKYGERDVINAAGEHDLLRHPGPGQPDLDDIDQSKDLRAGDVAFFNLTKTDGNGKTKTKTDDHVVQVVGNPSCSAGVCVMSIVEAPYTGMPVHQGTIAIDKNGNVSKLVTDENGKSSWNSDTGLTFNGGGTPPPNTGKSRKGDAP